MRIQLNSESHLRMILIFIVFSLSALAAEDVDLQSTYSETKRGNSYFSLNLLNPFPAVLGASLHVPIGPTGVFRYALDLGSTLKSRDALTLATGVDMVLMPHLRASPVIGARISSFEMDLRPRKAMAYIGTGIQLKAETELTYHFGLNWRVLGDYSTNVSPHVGLGILF